jgi:intracellular multiplication protein IcmO
LEVDPPIVGAMKNAVRKGQCLDVDKNYIPEQISTPLWAALPQFRSIMRKSPSLPIQDQEGILLASIMAHLDQKLFDAMDEDDPETDLPASDSHPHFDISVATSVQTLAPPEDPEATDSMAIEMFDMKSNIDETLIKMTKETDEQAYPQAPHTEAVSADDHQTDAERKRETASYAGSSLVASAPFLVDPVLLASRAGREITEREAIMYNEAANNVREMEEALGTSAEAARHVGISTAHAIAKAIDYPAGSSRPTKPTNEDEERLVLRDAGSVMEAWVAKTAASNPK